LFDGPDRAEMGHFASNMLRFKRVARKGGRGGGANWAIPARLNRGLGAVPVIGFGMDVAGSHL
jgi:hypothetical protein